MFFGWSSGSWRTRLEVAGGPDPGKTTAADLEAETAEEQTKRAKGTPGRDLTSRSSRESGSESHRRSTGGFCGGQSVVSQERERERKKDAGRKSTAKKHFGGGRALGLALWRLSCLRGEPLLLQGLFLLSFISAREAGRGSFLGATGSAGDVAVGGDVGGDAVGGGRRRRDLTKDTTKTRQRQGKDKTMKERIKQNERSTGRRRDRE